MDYVSLFIVRKEIDGSETLSAIGKWCEQVAGEEYKDWYGELWPHEDTVIFSFMFQNERVRQLFEIRFLEATKKFYRTRNQLTKDKACE